MCSVTRESPARRCQLPRSSRFIITAIDAVQSPLVVAQVPSKGYATNGPKYGFKGPEGPLTDRRRFERQNGTVFAALPVGDVANQDGQIPFNPDQIGAGGNRCGLCPK